MTPEERSALRRRLELEAEARIRMARAGSAGGGVQTAPGAVDDFGSRFRAGFEGFKDGATYGWGDSASAALGAGLGLTPGSAPFDYSGTFEERRTENLNNIRRQQDEAREAHPGLYTVGQIGGGAAQGVVTAPVATGQTLLGTAARGLGIGAAEGSLFAGGVADGENVGSEMLKGGVIGGVVGGLAPLAVQGGAAVKDMGLGAVDGLLDQASRGRANRAVASTIRQSGRSVDDIANAVDDAARAGQPMYRAVDAMGVAGQRRMSGLARSGGDLGNEISEYLQQRTIDAPDRMISFTDDAFGLGGQTREAIEGTVRDNRLTVANALYSRAAQDAKPVDVRGTVAALDDTIAKMDKSGLAPTDVVREFQKLRSQLAGMTPEGDPTTLSDYESVLALYRQVRNQVDNAYKEGRGDIGEALKPIRDSLSAALEESSDLFTTAQDLYRQGSNVVDAFEVGAQASRRGGRPENNISAFSAMNDQQKRAARVGYGDDLIRRIQGISAEAPNVPRQVASTKRQMEIGAMSLDPQLYKDQVQREADMFKVFNRATGGSRTADNLEDIADIGALADMARVGGSAAAGSPTGVLSNAASALRPYITGQNEATRRLIADALMSDNPRQALTQAANSGQTSEYLKRALEAFLRSTGRVAASQ